MKISRFDYLFLWGDNQGQRGYVSGTHSSWVAASNPGFCPHVHFVDNHCHQRVTPHISSLPRILSIAPLAAEFTFWVAHWQVSGYKVIPSAGWVLYLQFILCWVQRQHTSLRKAECLSRASPSSLGHKEKLISVIPSTKHVGMSLHLPFSAEVTLQKHSLRLMPLLEAFLHWNNALVIFHPHPQTPVVFGHIFPPLSSPINLYAVVL